MRKMFEADITSRVDTRTSLLSGNEQGSQLRTVSYSVYWLNWPMKASQTRIFSMNTLRYFAHCYHWRPSSRSVHVRTVAGGTERNRGHLRTSGAQRGNLRTCPPVLVLRSSGIRGPLLPRRNSPSSLRVDSHRGYQAHNTLIT